MRKSHEPLTKCLSIFFLLIPYNLFSQSSWNYPIPSGITPHPDYIVEARIAGSKRPFESIYTYSMQVCKNRDSWPGDYRPWDYDHTAVSLFDAPDTMEIRVTKTNVSSINKVDIRPFSKGITPYISGNSVSFFIAGPTKLSVEIDNEMYRNLNIIANSPDINIPSKTDTNVIWFDAGVHNIVGNNGTGKLELKTNKTLYLAPGAIVKGAVFAKNAENVTIRGRGILNAIDFADNSYQWTIEAWRCKDFLLEGILVTGSPDNTTVFSSCKNLIVRDFKVINGRHWDDAIHINAGKNILIEDCYTRTADDNIVFYGGNCVNYNASNWIGVDQHVDSAFVRNCITWSDVAHPMLIGTHGVYATGGSTLKNIIFKNIDVLEHRAPLHKDALYHGVMSITANDGNIVKNILFEDIRVERMTQGHIFHIQTNTNTDYSSGPGELADSISFKRVSWMGRSKLETPSAIKTESSSHPVKNIIFDHCQINSSWIKDATSGNLQIGTGVENIKFIVPLNEGPIVMINPANTIIKSGSRAKLKVVAAGKGNLHYQWYDGESGDTSKPVLQGNNPEFTSPAMKAKFKKYWVKISNDTGTVASKTAIVTTFSK